MSFNCSDCGQKFKKFKALQDHVRDKIIDHSSYLCEPCQRIFKDEDAFEQHVSSSKAHMAKHQCEKCDRGYSSEHALQDHLASPRHVRDTPLDRFFQSFPGFDYDPFSSPSAEMQRLRKAQGWVADSHENGEAWGKYRDALVQEFNSWFGTDTNNLASWQNLCKILRIEPVPLSCRSCREAIQSCHVNMVDLIAHQRGNLAEVKLFPNLYSLRRYTIRTRRFFPKDSLEAGALLKHLLRDIFGN